MFNDKEDKKLLEIFKSFDSNHLKKGYNEFVETIRTKGVYSLCRTFDNEILWSLYSDSHKGFVIEYDLDILLNDFNFNKIIPLVHPVEVRYEESPQKKYDPSRFIQQTHGFIPYHWYQIIIMET
ncbi:DUF2971 domain-containing protein [Chryseobacterium sp. SL1]|uniref:DUF2971 domain-containing protein n=1 Tax=Chryseobacterium sp. SL1 TaxID=2995159 RepID=UPI003FA39035